MAIAIIKQTQSVIFVEFPGRDSYESIMDAITRGNPEKAQRMFHLVSNIIRNGFNEVEETTNADIDV